MKTLKRNIDLVSNAKLRASIKAFLEQRNKEQWTSTSILNQFTLEDKGSNITEKIVRVCLDAMARNLLIRKIKARGRVYFAANSYIINTITEGTTSVDIPITNPGLGNGFELSSHSVGNGEDESPSSLGIASKFQSAKVVAKVKEEPTLKIDIIKETGKVRLHIQGLTIELGVV